MRLIQSAAYVLVAIVDCFDEYHSSPSSDSMSDKDSEYCPESSLPPYPDDAKDDIPDFMREVGYSHSAFYDMGSDLEDPCGDDISIGPCPTNGSVAATSEWLQCLRSYTFSLPSNDRPSIPINVFRGMPFHACLLGFNGRPNKL